MEGFKRSLERLKNDRLLLLKRVFEYIGKIFRTLIENVFNKKERHNETKNIELEELNRELEEFISKIANNERATKLLSLLIFNKFPSPEVLNNPDQRQKYLLELIFTLLEKYSSFEALQEKILSTVEERIGIERNPNWTEEEYQQRLERKREQYRKAAYELLRYLRTVYDLMKFIEFVRENLGRLRELTYKQLIYFFYRDFYRKYSITERTLNEEDLKKIEEEYQKSLFMIMEQNKQNGLPIDIKTKGKWVGWKINGGVNKNEEVGRIYLNLRPERLLNFLTSLSEKLAQQGLRATIKTPSTLNREFAKAVDKCVVYFPLDQIERIVNILRETYDENFFENSNPPFSLIIGDKRTGRLLKGIGFAEELLDEEESWGSILSEVLVNLFMFIRVRQNLIDQLENIKNDEIPRFLLHSALPLFRQMCSRFRLDPDDPSFNKGSQFKGAILNSCSL